MMHINFELMRGVVAATCAVENADVTYALSSCRNAHLRSFVKNPPPPKPPAAHLSAAGATTCDWGEKVSEEMCLESVGILAAGRGVHEAVPGRKTGV